MSGVVFLSDTHFFHRNICAYRPRFASVEEHNAYIMERLLIAADKRTSLYLGGDTYMVNTPEEAEQAKTFAQQLDKYYQSVSYCYGNHCVDKVIRKQLMDSLPNFKFGILGYKEFWITHAPIHPAELRGKKNIHGHVHEASLEDPNYINVCCENMDYRPISLDEIRAHYAPK